LSDSGFFLKLAGGGQQLCCLRTASPQGIAALAAQRGAATLTERGDETFPVGQFFLYRPGMKLRRTHDTPGWRVQKCAV
jgi:hypothetical protein